MFHTRINRAPGRHLRAVEDPQKFTSALAQLMRDHGAGPSDVTNALKMLEVEPDPGDVGDDAATVTASRGRRRGILDDRSIAEVARCMGMSPDVLRAEARRAGR